MIKSSQICCIIVTYNPDDVLTKLVNAIKPQVDTVIIVDNNSSLQIQSEIASIAKNNNFHFIKNAENLGIAKALNQGVIEAQRLHYEWAITFDQDTLPSANIVDIILEVYNLYHDKSKIGAIGVNFPVSHTNNYFEVSDKKNYTERDYLITSGCMLSLKIFFEVGGFREDFFIDNVDLEYSLRLRKHGKISLITKKNGMQHKAGAPKVRKLFGLNFNSSNHNIIRRYYMSRNHIILCKDYLFRFPFFIAKLNYFYILSLIKIMIVDDDKRAKLAASFKGVVDGLLYSSRCKKLVNDMSESYLLS